MEIVRIVTRGESLLSEGYDEYIAADYDSVWLNAVYCIMLQEAFTLIYRAVYHVLDKMVNRCARREDVAGTLSPSREYSLLENLTQWSCWIQRECIREYYRLLPHLTWSHVRIQPVVQCSVEKWSYSLTLHFCEPYIMKSSYKIRKILCFLVDCKSPWIVMERRDGPIQYDEMFVYNSMNGWRTPFENEARDGTIIETLDTDCKDIEF